MIQSLEEGRKEDGNRSIADKIIKRLHDLDKTVENNWGRWAWELLQNAKDSIAECENRAVSVQIELDMDKVTFRHNGNHFTEKDIRGLINQISSKETEEGQQSKKTGKFGTGFLTTHLLSKAIKVKGVLETANAEFYKFEFLLDREGKTTQYLIPKIENAWREFHSSAEKIEAGYDKNKFNTSFEYQLNTNEQKQIAQIGISEFIKLIPYVLVFIPKIKMVEIIDNNIDKRISFVKEPNIIENHLIPISKFDNNERHEILILLYSNEKVAIASEVTQTGKGYSIKNIEDVPKIFCDFPLIGTENFHFPVIVNSFYFNPQTERDGLWLKGSDLEVKENQNLFKSAVNLYGSLVSHLTTKPFFDLYNLAETKMPNTNKNYFDEDWYKVNIQNPLRRVVFKSNLVQLENEILENKSIENLRFPTKSFSDNIQIEI